MKKRKQILAWIAIILLVGMYLSTLIFALIGSETATALLRASVGCTILIPVVLYGMLLMMKNRHHEDDLPFDSKNDKET